MTLGLGALAYYLMKKSAGQSSPQPSPSPSPSPQPSPTPSPQPQPVSGLAITNYKLIYDYTTSNIIATGTVIYNGKPLVNQLVIAGFCSMLSGGGGTIALTDNNGNFSIGNNTNTPPGGSDCIYAQTSYKGLTATVKATIQIPPNPIFPGQPSPQPPPESPIPYLTLQIQNFNVIYDKSTQDIIAKGTVLYKLDKNIPLANQLVTVGFCINYPLGIVTYTDANGNFTAIIKHNTIIIPLKGPTCIFAETIYNKQKTKVSATIQIP
ncbi:MAG: hypothetical protein QXW71_00995 [Thermoplasmata archaeon]